MNNKERLAVLKKVLGLGNSQKDTTPEFEDVFNENYSKLLVNDKNIPELNVEPEPDYRCIRCFKVLTCLNYAYEGDVNKEWICNQCVNKEFNLKSKPVKECYICHKTINDGITTTHPSWSIYCSDCVLGMKL